MTDLKNQSDFSLRKSIITQQIEKQSKNYDNTNWKLKKDSKEAK